MLKRKFLFVFLIVLLASTFSYPIKAQEKTYLKVFEKDGTVLRIPTISLSDSVVSYQDMKDLFQFNVTLNRIMPTNVFSFPLETEGLEFLYQPPLNEELDPKLYDVLNATHAISKEETVYRPENVVGSYAVYRSDGKTGNEYTTGKLYHIYRPLLVDAKGATSWANLSITKTNMAVICDMDWLLKAVYPVVIDPSFGKTNVGASSNSWSSDWGVYSKATLSEAGTVTELHARDQATGSTINGKMAIYDHDAVNARPDNPQDISNALSVTTTASWYNYTNDVAVSAGIYWIGITHSGGFRLWYDTSATSDTAYKDTGYDSYPDPFGSCNFYTRIYSFYANYTTGGEEPVYVSCTLTETVSATATLSASKLIRMSSSQTTTMTIENGQVKSVFMSSTLTAQSLSDFTVQKLLHFTQSATSSVTATLYYSKLLNAITTEIFDLAIASGIAYCSKILYTSLLSSVQGVAEQITIKLLHFTGTGTGTVTATIVITKLIYAVTVEIFDTVIPSAITYCTKLVGITLLEISLFDTIIPLAQLIATYPSIEISLTAEQVLGIAIALIIVFFSIAISMALYTKSRNE